MKLEMRRRFLWAAVGGVLLVGLLQVLLPGMEALERGALQAAVLIVVSLLVFRFLPWDS